MNRSVHVAAVGLTAVFALSACGTTAPYTTSPSTVSPSVPAGSGMLGVSTTSLGTVVVDSQGMTVYLYTADTPGAQTSACTGGCAAAWPPVLVTGTPKVVGVTGTVGTIPGAGGKRQLTLNGWPLYTYASDAAAGDVKGQGSGGTWWVLSPGGTKITTPASGSSSGGASSGSVGGYGGSGGGY